MNRQTETVIITLIDDCIIPQPSVIPHPIYGFSYFIELAEEIPITFEWTLAPTCHLSRAVLNQDESAIDTAIFEFRESI